MSKIIAIKNYCQIKDGIVKTNSGVQFQSEPDNPFSSFAKACYQHFGLKYPKFHKMDNLSKLGFLAAEALCREISDFDSLDKTKTGLFLANTYSCLDTDDRYYKSMSGFASPGLFVYTLPNIVIGEICIRHRITGEHAFFLSEQFDFTLICNYVTDLFLRNQLNGALVGWVEFYDVNCHAFLMWVAPKTTAEPIAAFTPENALKLFSDIRR